MLGGFVGLALGIDRYLRPALGGGGNVFRLHLVGGFALCTGLHMTVELNALAVLYPGYQPLCGLLTLLQELDGRPRQELQATLHCADLQIGTAPCAVPELQVFHFHRLPGFKGGFLFRADLHVTDCIGAFPLVSPHILQFVRVPIPGDEHGDLLAAFRVFDLDDVAHVASALQVALFLLGEPVFMERALQQFLVLLHAVQLRYYRTVLSLIERELDIGRFEKPPTVPETV